MDPPASSAPRDAGVSGTFEPVLPERLGYRIKCRLLGPPLTTARLHQERLSKTTALGVLSPDCISSSAYGPEQVLIELLPYAALAAFTILLPITGVILVILILLTLSYRQVVMLYTRAGGSYVVARDNFGPKTAQIAAVALLIDYVVTVAVQSAAGTVAVVSAVPALGPYSLEITVGAVLLLAYGNLRGLKEAGRAFAFPMYFFAMSIGIVIVVGVIQALTGNLDRIDPTTLDGAVEVHHADGLVMGATVLVILRAFANGGTSLTGLEAISNGVSAFQKPEGPNARRALVIMACILAFLVSGVSLLAYLTHATPYAAGYPSVISQEARIVFGSGTLGDVLFVVVQIATALILFTGANTSFNGFPFLASFVADDAFLPRQLRRRGHRLVFSNAIIVLTAVAIVLLIATDAKVNALVPFYAIGVFTGFTMAGLGMARHHQKTRAPGWRRGIAINLAAGITSLIVVAIFAIAKFTEGAWVVVIVFPIMVLLLIRLNREYRNEAAELRELGDAEADTEAVYSHHIVIVLVDALDLATIEALRYGRSLRPSELRAVHFVLDSARAANLKRQWENSDLVVPLELIECPDRRLYHGVLEMIARATAPRTEISVLLPRRIYGSILGRVLHDRTAEHIAKAISDVPHAVAIIVPFDASNRTGVLRAPPPPPTRTSGRGPSPAVGE
ncbi:APC family permease [Rhodococcus sp. TAF43]|uniref:APC family permease n=1 Tax=Rhodococcus sp. TAF43 TaxID=3237483 RepID=UPI003F984982